MTKSITVLTAERWHEIRAKLIESRTYDPARPPCEYWPDDRCRYSRQKMVVIKADSRVR